MRKFALREHLLNGGKAPQRVTEGLCLIGQCLAEPQAQEKTEESHIYTPYRINICLHK